MAKVNYKHYTFEEHLKTLSPTQRKRLRARVQHLCRQHELMDEWDTTVKHLQVIWKRLHNDKDLRSYMDSRGIVRPRDWHGR